MLSQQIHNTGRLNELLHSRIREVIFGDKIDDYFETDLNYATEIDKAHLCMLVTTGVLELSTAKELLLEILNIQKSGFNELNGLEVPRGWYLTYEKYLIDRLGENVGGKLHTARSRNDLHATVFRMRLREEITDLLEECLKIRRQLSNLTEGGKDLFLPIHTQYQPAVPSTFGHYFNAINEQLGEDIDVLQAALSLANKCPMGACAAGGTSIPTDPAITASYLGFDDTIGNSLKAVASYNDVLQIMCSLNVLALTMTRLFADIQTWCSYEYNFTRLSDKLQGSSSILPQKANPFVLEHIKGGFASIGGYLNSAFANMTRIPFTNSIEVKKEGAVYVWEIIRTFTKNLILSSLVLENLILSDNILEYGKGYHYVFATYFSETLVREKGIPFRQAHFEVGQLVKDTIQSKGDFVDNMHSHYPELSIWQNGNTDLTQIIDKISHGGGPSNVALEKNERQIRKSIEHQQNRLRRDRVKQKNSREQLDQKVQELIN